MPGAVGHVGNQLRRGAFGSIQFLIHNPAEQLNQINVFPFVKAANVVRFAESSVMENRVDGAGMIDHKQPVANVFALAVHGQGFVLLNVMNHQRNQLFGEMIRAVVVRAVRQHNRQFIGVAVGPHEMVRSGFGSRIRRLWIVGGFFGKKLVGVVQRPIHFIRRDVVETFPGKSGRGRDRRRFGPGRFGRIQQVYRPHHVGHHKRQGISNGAVYVRLSRQVNNAIELLLSKKLVQKGSIRNVTAYELVIGCLFDISQISQIARIRQFIEVNDLVVGVFRYE